MGTHKGKRTLITTLSILGILLVVIGAIALLKMLSANNDPYVQKQAAQDTSQSDAAVDEEADATEAPKTETPAATTETQSDVTLDSATVSTIDITSMAITVSYVKGIGAFEYEVLRADNGTRYVEFRSLELVSGKCTGDAGTFASIIADPNSSDSATLSKTTTLDGTVYGLSLAGANCADNAETLQDYQKSFSDAFGLLKKLD